MFIIQPIAEQLDLNLCLDCKLTGEKFTKVLITVHYCSNQYLVKGHAMEFLKDFSTFQYLHQLRNVKEKRLLLTLVSTKFVKLKCQDSGIL
jgi:hypothetical protein